MLWRWALVCVVGTAVACRQAPPVSTVDRPFEPRSGAPRVLSAPVVSCGPVVAPDIAGREIPVLFDSSGSMNGFYRTGAITAVHKWTDSAISRGLGVRARAYSFNRGLGIQKSSSPPAFDYKEMHDTNLREALEMAGGSPVSVLVTDGIPFSGGGDGSCAGGADVGCIARTLKDFVAKYSGAGLWIIPIVGRYDGKFFTEGQTLPDDATPGPVIEQSIKKIFPDAEVAVTVDPQSRPPMAYKGPRLGLVVVLAQDAQLGRTLVASLGSGASLAQVAAVGDEPRGFGKSMGLAYMTPLELYPGSLSSPFSLELSKNGEQVDTIDASVVAGEAPELHVACQAGFVGRVPYRLLVRQVSGGPRCALVYSLPTISLTLAPREAASPDELAALGRVLGEQTSVRASLDSRTPFGADLDLQCSNGERPQCSSAGQGTLRLTATLSYPEAAGQLGSPGEVPPASYLGRLSTDDLPRNPHAVLGLSALVTDFLGLVSVTARAQPIGSIRVCSEQ